jgi:hypothetical protein
MVIVCFSLTDLFLLREGWSTLIPRRLEETYLYSVGAQDKSGPLRNDEGPMKFRGISKPAWDSGKNGETARFIN